MLILNKKQAILMCSIIKPNCMVLLKTGMVNSVLPFLVQITPKHVKRGLNFNKTLLN